jgi:hypothetical protein
MHVQTQPARVLRRQLGAAHHAEVQHQRHATSPQHRREAAELREARQQTAQLLHATALLQLGRGREPVDDDDEGRQEVGG